MDPSYIATYVGLSLAGAQAQAARVREMMAEAEGDSNEESGLQADPFSPEATIPLPFQLGDEYGYYGPTAIWKRNERERHRVRCLNDGYEKLRAILPAPDSSKDRRLSKVDTLRLAIRYIHHLQLLLSDDDHHRTCNCNLLGPYSEPETPPPPRKRRKEKKGH